MTGSIASVQRGDGEVVGQVRSVDGEMWVPETVFGGVLGSATEYATACSTVLNRGLSSLLEPWWMEDGGTWDRVELVEVRADRVRVRPWSPFNNAIGGHAGPGHWVNTSENLLALREPSQP